MQHYHNSPNLQHNQLVFKVDINSDIIVLLHCTGISMHGNIHTAVEPQSTVLKLQITLYMKMNFKNDCCKLHSLENSKELTCSHIV